MEEFPVINRVVRGRYGSMLYKENDVRVGRSLAAYGEYAEFEIALLKQLIKPGNVVVEVGANIGMHSIALAGMVGAQGSLMTFEAQRILFQDLCANLALNNITNTFPFHMALGDENRTARVATPDYLQEGDFGAVALTDDFTGEQVNMVTLDSLHLRQLDMMVIDTFGTEANVLAGAARTLQEHKPKLYVDAYVQVERKTTVKVLEELGYEVFLHTPLLFNPKNIAGQQTNIFGEQRSDKFFALPEGHGLTLKNMQKVTSDSV